jgi:2,3-bisphosphoglycerate-dependent phosphoglycerate mutase
MGKGKLVLLRHGESTWNKKKIFTGWVDIPLTQQGIEEAIKAGENIKSIPFDVIYTSTLIRAQMTAFLAMSRSEHDQTPCMIHEGDAKFLKMAKVYDPKNEKNLIPVYAYSELNERMYGSLQGLSKEETLKKYGEQQFTLWRRSYKISPPEGESLQMTAERTIPFFEKRIIPHLKKGENVLVSAHGNSLRSIVMLLDELSEEEVIKLEIPTGEPICYEYNKDSWKKQNIYALNNKS